jgi:uncharacterized protein YjiS (DUF1127 family)
MSTPFHQQGYVALKRSESFGSIKRFAPVGPAATHVASPNTPSARTELEAIALRTFAGGFGDAEIGQAQPLGAVDSIELYHLARGHRSYRLAEIFAAMVQATAAAGRRMLARWKRKRQARATYVALRGLSERTLRDLGFDRSELLSVATEAAGGDCTRVRLQAARS